MRTRLPLPPRWANTDAGYDAQGKLVGVAAEGSAQGYSGSVDTIYASQQS
ncbi:MAG: hypothetical protein QJT81_20540 [Candidatus Thiothrix putei]|uniref:Uncharacterized protein n=1 Tax=Candidatus Thiothrix putei TaxID=3080811 RepID=A0AA95KM60_9GAMM|nr:MAG: hypothetical protein QJT81_20540 [Candidatus Thiothrix putei]